MNHRKIIAVTLLITPVLALVTTFTSWLLYINSDDGQFLQSGSGYNLTDDEWSVFDYELAPLLANGTNSWEARRQLDKWLGSDSLEIDKTRLLQQASSSYPYAKHLIGKHYLWKEVFGFRVYRKQGMRLVKEAAEEGSADAQIQLARHYSKQGRVVFNKQPDRDDLNCFKYYLMAAEQGHPDACFNIGIMYIEGIGCTKNNSEGLSWIKNALEYNGNQFLYNTQSFVYFDRRSVFTHCLTLAEQGNPSAQLYVGRAYLFGEDGAPHTDKGKGWGWVQKAIDQNYAEAQYMRAYHLLGAHSQYSTRKPLLPKDAPRAIELTTKAAINGSASAQLNMYNNLRFGSNGCSEDEGLALKYLKMAAEGGCALAQEWMGDHYAERANDLHSAMYHELAALWYERAWRNGSEDSLSKLRESLLNAKRYHEAFPYWRMAAQNDPNAQYIVGIMYLNGQGVKKNLEKAIFWLKTSALYGNNVEAQHTLSYCYHKGIGVLEDYQESYAWSLVSSKNGGDQAMKDLLQKELTMELITAAQVRAKELQKEIESALNSKS